MSRKSPYTKVEVIEERHPNQPADSPMVKFTDVLVNGQKVRVAKDGITIDYGDDCGDGTREVRVILELQVDDFRIHQVAPGYTDQ